MRFMKYGELTTVKAAALCRHWPAKELLKNVALSGEIEKSSVVVKTNQGRARVIGDVLETIVEFGGSFPAALLCHL